MKEKRKTTGTPSAPILDLPQLEQILSFMAEHGLEEFEYCRGDLQIRMKKASSNSVSDSARSLQLQSAAPHLVPASFSADTKSPLTQTSTDSVAQTEESHVVKSPIVGTFYEATSPGAEPFVKVGDHVDAGQVLCIIEAMKLMNEIESDIAGEVLQVLVKNGQPVEYGEPLFILDPTRGK